MWTQHFEPVPILLNNAGTPGPAGNHWEVDADGWWECIELTVCGAFLFNPVVIPEMIRPRQWARFRRHPYLLRPFQATLEAINDLAQNLSAAQREALEEKTKRTFQSKVGVR